MAFFSAEHKPLAIHVNAAAFQDHVMSLAAPLKDGHELLQLKFLCDAIRKLVVMLPVRIFGPGIKSPIGERDALIAGDKDWSGIAGPYAVGGPDVKLYLLHFDVAVLQDLACGLLFTRGSHDQVYIFGTGKVPDDVSKNPRNGVEFSRPVRAVMRPGQPCGLMWLPFGRHAITERTGRIGHRRGPDAARLNPCRLLSLCRTCRE